MIRATLLVLAIVSVAVMPSIAEAQTRRPPAPTQRRQPPQRDKFEVSAGGLWLGGAALGSAPAEIRANNLSASAYRLFTTQSRAAAAPGFETRVTYWVTRKLGVEGGLAFVRPELRTSVSGDVEGAGALTIAEQLDQYFVDVSAVWLLDQWRFGRTLPFVTGGAGYLRQLHEGRTLVETGTVYHVGGGIRHPLVANPRWSLGLKGQGRIYVLADGVQLAEGTRTHGAVSGAIYVMF